jgi:hypothetical protein
MRIRVVRAAAKFPDGGYVCVRKSTRTGNLVVLLNSKVFTEQDVVLMSDRLQRNPGLLLALGVAAM